MDKPTANAQLADSSIVHSTNVARVGKKITQDVLRMLGQLRDELTAKLASPSVMTDWQERQRATELLRFAKDQIGGTYEKISDKTATELDGLGKVELERLSRSVDHVVGVELSARMAPQTLEAVAGTKRLLVQGALTSKWFGQQSDSLAHNFSAEIQRGLLRGAPIQDMTKPVRDLLQVKAVQAEATVRTCVASVQSEAARRYFDENADIISGVCWLATLEVHRTCLTCANLDGRAWSWPDLKPLGGNKVTFPDFRRALTGIVVAPSRRCCAHGRSYPA